MSGLPHESWAGLYDAVYRRGYGRFYEWMTRTTLEQIGAAVPPPARVVDFGAGTGRLAIPLAEAGYRVTAVEPVREMLDVLEVGARVQDLEVETFHGRINQFHPEPVFDLAICVFTVLLYILDEETLDRSFRAVSESLRPGGMFLVDVPRMEMFTGGVVRGEGVKREMKITPRGGDLFDYVENTSVEIDGRTEKFREAFTIRHWPKDLVLERLALSGFAMVKDISPLLRRSGCEYFLLRKAS